MSENREVFEKAMREAANVAWEGDWEAAIEAYQRALSEVPDDVDALIGLGMAYFSAGRPEDALESYQRANDLASEDDPMLWERIGEAREELGRADSAAEAYLTSAEHYLEQQAPHRALERWQDAARACPRCVQPHVALLKHYQSQGQAQEAADECLALARIYQDRGQFDYAIQLCQHALKLVPHNSEALSLLESLRYSKQAAGERGAEEKPEPSSASPGPEPLEEVEEIPDSAVSDLQGPLDVEAAGEKGSPVVAARQKALTELAESVFAEEEAEPAPAGPPQLSKEEVDALVSKAIDFQTRGKVEEAIAAYEKVIEAGGERAAAHFNLGLLYQDELRFEDAAAQFEQVVSHPDYKLGSHFALGECYRARGRIDQALEHFIEALKIVDLVTVERDHADDLIQLYENLADVYLAKGDKDQALKFTDSLVTFLSEQGWEDKVKQARQRLDTLAREGPALSLAEMLRIPKSERILELVALSQEYVKRGLFYAALEECYYALDYAPDYLPVHRQLAETLVEMRKGDAAMTKLVTIADTYRVRGNIRQAMAMYQRGLKLAPMEMAVRTKLIDLLISHGEIDHALEQYMALADSYYQLAQMGKAREVYQEALRLAPRGDQERGWKVRILHKIGDIRMQRVDWKGAVEIYERIRDIAPEDERARLRLMDLYYRLERPNRAIRELDDLLDIYREDGRMERVFTILNDAVDRWPEVISLRARLAQAHLNAGHADEALEHLDRLGEMQLDVGRQEAARSTIRAIIALRPPNVEEYEQLLDQLGS